jgi:tetratricopeptide (TPR) repeat protein
MKTTKNLLTAVLLVGVAFVAGWWFATTRKTAAVSVPVLVFKAKAAPVAGAKPTGSNSGAAPSDAAGTAPDEAGMALAAAVDTLTSAQSTYAQKQAVRDQLRKGGQLEAAIGAIKQLAAQNPNDAGIATALGDAEIAQLRTIAENGGDQNEIAILAMQADQSFNAALAVDPSNWEAQFMKAASLSHWPAALGKGPEVIQRLSALVTQQETGTPQPQYAATYALLGQQYRAAGQPDKATQIWQQGLALYPLNTTLQHALAAPSPAP